MTRRRLSTSQAQMGAAPIAPQGNTHSPGDARGVYADGLEKGPAQSGKGAAAEGDQEVVDGEFSR